MGTLQDLWARFRHRHAWRPWQLSLGGVYQRRYCSTCQRWEERPSPMGAQRGNYDAYTGGA